MNTDNGESVTGADEERWYLPPRLLWVRAGVWVCSIVGAIAFIYMRVTVTFDSVAWWSALVIGVGGVIGLQAVKSRIRREPPFCIRCGYSLRGLPDNHRCPECGSPYDLGDCRLYQQDPLAYRERKGREAWEERSRVAHGFLDERRRHKRE